MVELKVQVPRDRVGDFYVLFGEWVRGLGPQSSAPRRAAWGQEDTAAARSLREAVPTNGAALLDLLIREGELDSESIAKRLGLNDAGQVTGVAGWVGRVANTVGRVSPITTRQLPEGTVWRVDPDVAELFKQ